jgi:hypothetical protein
MKTTAWAFGSGILLGSALLGLCGVAMAGVKITESPSGPEPVPKAAALLIVYAMTNRAASRTLQQVGWVT